MVWVTKYCHSQIFCFVCVCFAGAVLRNEIPAVLPHCHLSAGVACAHWCPFLLLCCVVITSVAGIGVCVCVCTCMHVHIHMCTEWQGPKEQVLNISKFLQHL